MTNQNPKKRMVRKRKHIKGPKRTVNKLNLWAMILVFVLIIQMIVSTTGLIVIYKMINHIPELAIDDFYTNESSVVYDRNGKQIADVGTQIRQNVKYEEVSESLIDAFLAVEDSRFFEHNGFDLARFTKSMIENVKSLSFKQGGSTFTMQLTKLTYFQNDEAGTTRVKSIEYKVQQIALAIQLEKKSNKKDIFQMYLNKLNFGGTGNIRGVQKAAEYYYGKSAGELNLAEAAMLAGVINSPYYYDPHNFLDRATNRRNNVLKLMKRHGYITNAEYNLAYNIKVEDTLIDPASRKAKGYAYAFQSYIDEAIKEAERVTGYDPLNTAMDIYTAMNPDAQQVMDDIQAGRIAAIAFPDDLMEVGMISIDNHTGEIVAIGGGRNYGNGGAMLLNHATEQYKQPGSSVKPFLDYALAFEYLGWASDHVVTDRPMVYQGTNLVIKNANNTYVGQVPLKYAVGVSLNTPAIQALQDAVNKAGWQTVVNYLTSLGFSKVSGDNFDIGFAIGGSNFICSAKELAAAHAVIMNGGNYITPHTVNKIVFRNGQIADYVAQYDAQQVLSPQAAYLTAELMFDAVNTEYYNFMHLLKRDYPVYGKTGTTDWGTEGIQYNIPQGASKDKWMVSETTKYTNVVWVGYEKGIKDADTYFNQAKSLMNIPGNISSHLISVLNDEEKPQGLQRPDGLSEITHIIGTFPYASPIEGMNPDLITTGLVKSQFATLASPESTEVKILNTFGASGNPDGTINLSWEPYPDGNALKTAEDTMDISLYGANGNIIIEAYGKRLFDYSWAYGPIRYKATVKQFGEVVGEITTDQIGLTTNINGYNPVHPAEVCGFYGYESGSGRSNEICIQIAAAATPEPTAPSTPTPATTTNENEKN